MTDKQYMQMALSLAKKGAGSVSPNPLVGAVIVKDGKVIGKGYHKKYGQFHAERNALANYTENLKGATMYVTLEPCCHHGKTPPCTQAIIESSMKKVVIGSLDPNPLMRGKGVEILKNAGIEVECDVLKEKCIQLNEVFFHYITTKTPFVVMKYAMTQDGKITSCTGNSKWITSEESRKNVHKDRNKYSAIMVGVGTVLTDNPLLTCRLKKGRNPIRIICDTNLRTPINSIVVATAKETRTIIATGSNDNEKRNLFLSKGCEIINVPLNKEHIDLQNLMQQLGAMKIDSILLEGGETLNFSAFKSGIVNKVQAYIAPKIFGGTTAKTPVGGDGFSEMYDAIQLNNPTIKRFGDDILIESEVKHYCLQEL